MFFLRVFFGINVFWWTANYDNVSGYEQRSAAAQGDGGNCPAIGPGFSGITYTSVAEP
jgi:hypothetical protein